MPADDGRDIVVVSDLHLSAGYDERSGTYSRNEDFFYDGAFARFLAHLEGRARSEGRRWRLVILGDLFDFLQVELDPPPRADQELDTSEATTLRKLDRIASGHAEFFAALGRFAAGGFPVDVVVGNHDIELIRPATQRRLVELVVALSGRPEAAESIAFYPWIYFVPGVLYAEHGHQYDDVNSFPTQLEPSLGGDPDRIDLPLGSYFVGYLFNRIEAIDPFADNVKPATSYLLWALETHPVRVVWTLGAHLRLLVAVLMRSRDVAPPEWRARRARYHQGTLARYARSVGLRHETVVAIDRLAAIPAMTSKRRQLRALLLRPIVRFLPPLAALLAVYTAVGRLGQGPRSFALFAAGVAGLLLRERRALRPATEEAGYLHRAALRIHALLAGEGKAVLAYVFGHSHTAEQFPLTKADRPPHYLNSGTWTPRVPAAFALLGGREQFAFVQVTRPPDRPPLVRLMVWNDVATRPEPLPLLST
ncbi:MAG TPA: metallophosphoesterase [Chloroflexota bacterium]|jgi:UDP-2,3-diacylglucosamine pyrophosphatase LpxH|nr:metallophosphoesterase [Chloroflexota bacterium]